MTHDVATKKAEQDSLEIRREQLQMLYSNMPALMPGTIIAGVLHCLLQIGTANPIYLALWVIAMSAVVAYRFMLTREVYSHGIPAAKLTDWERSTAAHAFFSGSLWACMSILSLQTDSAAVFLTVNGMLMLQITIPLPAATQTRYYVTYAVPMMAAVTGSMIIWLDELNKFFVMIFVAAFLVLFLASRRVEQTLEKSIAIRFENKRLIEELSIQKEQAERARAEAERANVAKSKFLAAASHDLRQPLHALGLYLDAMKAESTPERQQELTRKIGVANDALKALFQSLLDISKLDAGIVTPQHFDFLIADVFEKIDVHFRPLANNKKLDLVFDYGEVAIYSDKLLLERILYNLVSNAIRYTQSGSITVSAVKQSTHIVIEVQDTGEGIPESEQDKIFNEFYQLHNPERDRTKGLGLGLSIVKRLCQLLGYPLELESQIGKGSKFSLTIPAGNRDQIVDLESKPSRFHWDLRGIKVLVVDDEENIRDAMTQLLNGWGCEVNCADTIDEIVTVLNDGFDPDLVIADYRLRGSETGVLALEKIDNYLDRNIPGILITGDTAPERLQEAKRSKYKLLHKPVNAGQLRVVIGHLLKTSLYHSAKDG